MVPMRLRPPRRNRGCPVCGKRLTPQRKDAPYCSPKCKQEAWHWKQEREKGE